MKLAPLVDRGAIDALLTDPWIAARISHDERAPGYIDHPALTYTGAYVGGELAGLFATIRHGAFEIESHIALAQWAVRHGRELARLYLGEQWRNPALQRVTAPVLATLPRTANFCRRLGFALEGVRRCACQVGGAPTDVLMFGMVREEWEKSNDPVR